MNSLDLYAEIESMIGFEKQYDFLYDLYVDLIVKLDIESVLDVGCGNGSLLLKLKELNIDSKGIDISSKMVEVAKSKGVDVENLDLAKTEGKFKSIVCVADVLNYMSAKELNEFFALVDEKLEDRGYFIFDINTRDGFELVADGTFIKDEESQFLAIDATFENSVLTTDIFLFEQSGDKFEKQSGTILQYFHKVKDIKKALPLRYKEKVAVSVFGNEIVDKEIFVFQKR